MLADDKLAATVLLDRRPAWLQSFATWYLRADVWEPVWPLVRALVRAGAIERPEAGLYFDGLLAASRAPAIRRSVLREDPALAADVWDLIALGGGARDTLRPRTPPARAGRTRSPPPCRASACSMPCWRR